MDNKIKFFDWKDFRIKIFAESILVGLFAGILVVLYRYAVEKAISTSKAVYGLLHIEIWLIPVWFFILSLLGYFVGYLVEKEPMAAGSGIPQVKAVVLKKLKMNWLNVLLVKFIGGVLSILAGLSLGREGPSIQIGAVAGQGISKILKRKSSEESILLTFGASAGLSAAFNAPLAGILFSLEELHKKFSPIVLMGSMTASVTAEFVVGKLFGLKRVFNFSKVITMQIENFEYVIVLGLLTGFLGIVFNRFLLGTQDLYSYMKFPKRMKTVLSFLIAGVVGFFFVDVLGGGVDLVEKVYGSFFPLKVLLILVVIKFFFTMTSYASSAPGGIFLPMLVIGALIGAIYGNVCTLFFGLPKEYIGVLIVLSMAGYFTSIVRAPVTGIVLISEMTGSFNNILPLSAVALISYLVAELFDCKPIYDSLLKRIVK